MTTDTKAVSADELLRLSSDGCRYELLHGELVKMAPSGQRQGKVAAKILISLGNHIQKHGLGQVYAAETGFKLASSPDHVRAPDAAFVAKRRLQEVGDVEGYWPGAPDLIVEVVSPSDTYAEVEDKVADWLKAGCRMVIVASPRKQSVSIYRSPTEVRVLGVQDIIDGDDVLPGWRLAVSELLEG